MEGTMLILRFWCNFWSTTWINYLGKFLLVGVGLSYTKCCLQFGLANNSGMANNSWQNRAIAQNRLGYYHFEVSDSKGQKRDKARNCFCCIQNPHEWKKLWVFMSDHWGGVMVGSSLRSEFFGTDWTMIDFYPSPSWALPMPKSHKNMPQTLRGSTWKNHTPTSR